MKCPNCPGGHLRPLPYMDAYGCSTCFKVVTSEEIADNPIIKRRVGAVDVEVIRSAGEAVAVVKRKVAVDKE